MHPFSHLFLSAFALTAARVSPARSAAPLSLLDAQVTPSSAQVTWTRSDTASAPGMTVTIQPGEEGYPGITLAPEGKVWDLSSYGHVEACVKNLGAKPVSVCLRIDDDGDWKANPWNAENLYLQPGATGTVKVIFGYLFGYKPGYALKSASVTKLLLFAGKSKETLQSFRLESLAAAGATGEKPPADPNSIRIVPPAGVLLSAKDGLEMRPETRHVDSAWSGPKSNGTLRVTFAPGKSEGRIALKPPLGRWNLRSGTEFRAALRNAGKQPLTATVTLESNGGPTDTFTATLPPGVSRKSSSPSCGQHSGTAMTRKAARASRATQPRPSCSRSHEAQMRPRAKAR